MLVCSTIRALAFGDLHQAKQMMFCSRLSLETAEELVHAESFVGDVLFEPNYHTFETNRLNLRIDHFQNDDHCEAWTRLSKGELSDLIDNRLGLDEYIFVHHYGIRFFRFHREEILFVCAQETHVVFPTL